MKPGNLPEEARCQYQQPGGLADKRVRLTTHQRPSCGGLFHF